MHWRFVTLRLVSLLSLIVLLGRLAQLQFVDDNGFRDRAAANTTRIDYIEPIRGEIYASDGQTLLAASIPIFNVAVRQDTLPPRLAQRNEVFSRVAEILALTDTLVISPAAALAQHRDLRADLRRLLGPLPAPAAAASSTTPVTLSLTIPHSQSLAALALTRRYTDVLTYDSYVGRVLQQANLPPYLPVTIKRDVPRDVALVLRENQSALPGVEVLQSYRRGYPLSGELPSLSHLLGYTRRITGDEYTAHNPENPDALPNYLLNDMIGKDGVEKVYERDLRGALGIKQIEVDVNQVPVGEPLVLRPKRDGHNLVLSIDARLQRHAEATLHKWLAEAERRRERKSPHFPPINKGVVVLMDVNTGAILASVSLPSYDNNAFTRPILTQEESDAIYNPPDIRGLNRAIQGIYPPGSTFKQISAAVALQLGIISPDTQLHDPGLLILENEYDSSVIYRFPNSILGDRGHISVVEALMNSSNVFFHQVIGGNRHVRNLQPNDWHSDDGLGVDQFAKSAIEWFGLGEPTGIDLPGEVGGIMPTREWLQKAKDEAWTVGKTYHISIGQGDVLMTPLQLLQVMASIANGGTRYRPHVAKAITTTDGEVVRAIEPEVTGRLPIEPQYLDVIKQGLFLSVHDKRAHNVQVARPDQVALYDALKLAGKTGTAEYVELLGPDGNKQLYKRSHAWFVGFAPYDNPQVAAVVFLEGAGDLYDGSATLALPAVADLMAGYFQIDPATLALPQGQRKP